MSYDLIRVLKSIAVKEHRTIMCSIHQPSSQVFYTFNSIVLLMEGKVALSLSAVREPNSKDNAH